MKRLYAIFFSLISYSSVVAQMGVLDASFVTGTGANNIVYTSNLQTNGKIIIGGIFNNYNGTTGQNRIARLNTDGSLDATFTIGTGANQTIISSEIQPADGKILIGGNFTSYNGTNRSRIARLNTDGTIDLTFDPGAGVNSSVFDIEVQPDGKIILVGNFTTANFLNRNYIIRLNADGSIDNTFNIGIGTNAYIWSVARQPSDGKLIICGNFTTYNGVAANRVARINTDGTIDNTFNVGAGANDIAYRVVLQPDGKALVGGAFTTFDGVPAGRLVRLNTDGTQDASFNLGAGADDEVWAITVLPNNRIMIGGLFSNVDGLLRPKIAKLNSNGTVDLNFVPTTGASNIVRNILVQTDNNLVICGNFITYNGTTANRIARVINNYPLPVELISFKGNAMNAFNEILWSTSSEINSIGFDVERSADGLHFETIGFVESHANSQVVNQYHFIDQQLRLNTYQYRLKIKDIDGKYTYSDVITLSNSKTQGQLFVYPNPVIDVMHIQSDIELKKASFIIYDMTGHQVRSFSNIEGLQTSFSLESLAQGLYVGELRNGQTVQRYSFAKK